MQSKGRDLFDSLRDDAWQDIAYGAKMIVPVVLLALFWCWETLRPYFDQRNGRTRHGVRNLSIAVFNTAALSVSFAIATVAIAQWAEDNRIGVLNAIPLPFAVSLTLAILVLDGWMYFWHRANHQIGFLWRFHRMHHSDNKMDVTTATRFHIGEHCGAATIRFVVIVAFGLTALQVTIYECLVIAITQFHHANISIGKWDPLLRKLFVTPDMHKVHHSDIPGETNSNYSTLFSFWDRLAGTDRDRANLQSITFGIKEMHNPELQTICGMMQTPFLNPKAVDIAEEQNGAIIGIINK